VLVKTCCNFDLHYFFKSFKFKKDNLEDYFLFTIFSKKQKFFGNLFFFMKA
jgi:hypothetical protein